MPPIVGDDLDESPGPKFDVPRRNGDGATVRHSIGRVSARIQQSEVQLFGIGIEGP
jgi:hypothetical protein